MSNPKSVFSGKTETKVVRKAVKKTAIKQPKAKSIGKPFVKGKSGNPKGRPRKLVSTIISAMKEQGVEPLKQSQIIDAYEILLQLTQKELTKMVLDHETPMFMRIIGKAMLSSKGSEIIETMLDRAHGRAKQSVDVKADVTNNNILDLSKLSTEDLLKLDEINTKLANSTGTL